MNGSHCLENGTEIGIIQRDRTTPLTPAAINFIKDIIRTQTCEDPERLETLPVPGFIFIFMHVVLKPLYAVKFQKCINSTILITVNK